MLTVTAITKAKPTDRQYRMADERGLVLLVRPNGSKLWQLRFRHEGKEKTASLGQFPDVSLSDARTKREELRKQVAAGNDPVAVEREVKEAKLAKSQNTFEAVAREWLEIWRPLKSPRHAEYVTRRLETDVFPAIGARPIVDVESKELVKMAKAIESRGASDIAKRSLQTVSQVFKHAIAHGKAKSNPATAFNASAILKPTQRTNYARLDATELPMLLRKIEAYQGTPTTRLAVKLMALTFVRTGELIGARWSEFDLEAARWDIPAVRMKMKSPHTVPLCPQALEVLRTLHTVTGGRELLFPGERDHEKCMSNNTILKALARMGYKGKMTGHGFRGIASTVLHEHGFDHAHIELQLAHMERNEVSAAYNHALYLPQRAKLMAWWGEYLEGLTRGNVLPLRRLVA
jgi:integrase